MLTCCLIKEDLKRMKAFGGRGMWVSFFLPWLTRLKDMLASLSVASLSAGGNNSMLVSAHSGSSGEVKDASVMLGANEIL